jgi:exodeoxyribonuclease-3
LRQRWDRAFYEFVAGLEKKKPIIFTGDLNVAHKEIDLARPKENKGKKGFTDEERAGFQRYVDNGYLDTFRMFTKEGGHYSWWTHWANARARNVGWRIDYFMASDKLKGGIRSAKIHADVMGSDHAPISLELA